MSSVPHRASLPPSPPTANAEAITGPRETAEATEFSALYTYLLDQSQRCMRPPVDRFEHPWLAPMALSPGAERYLAERRAHRTVGHVTRRTEALSAPASGDGFTGGDYGLGLFHHDVSEAAIELLHHERFHDAIFGSLICFLDCASPNGRIQRIELPHKSREAEPAKPVMAQFALRIVQTMGTAALEQAARHKVLPKILRFFDYLETHYAGLHGLFLTHSSLASGFDNDILTAGLPDCSVEGPDTNAFMVLEYRAAAELAKLLGADAQADALLVKAEILRQRMEDLLWYEDDHGGMYVGLRWQHGVGSLDGEVVSTRGPGGKLRPLESWVSLLPLYAGIPSNPRAARIIDRLLDPEGYWGPVGPRTAPARHEFFQQAPRVMHYDFKKQGRGPVSNWMGPVWVLSSYYLAQGLARYGYRDRATEIALKTARLVAGGLSHQEASYECYDDTGRGLWPRAGTFVSWNVLCLTLLRNFAPELTVHWPKLPLAASAHPL